jgi:SpoVK/Ycf46/Vps4 family AAA+-type ATPase
MFVDKKKQLFDEAYVAYLEITNCLEKIHNNISFDAFQYSDVTVRDMICDLDLFLQGTLLEIAVSDGRLADEEMEFIMTLPDELDEVCSRHKGYKRFLKSISIDNYQANATKFYTNISHPEFLEFIKRNDYELFNSTINCIEKILNTFVAIDDIISECENNVVSKIIAKLKGNNHNNQEVNITNPRQTSDLVLGQDHQDLDQVLEELNSLIGLTRVKEEVLANINLLKINNMRKEKSLPELQISKHMVFAGHPGTGKTTVARIMSKIYKSLGVVSQGHLIETDRSGMVAGYVGQTALKTAQIINKAKGGILFIDEAYSLSSASNGNDFGREAIDTLVKGMEDFRDDLIVIVAGYTGEMTKFINMNPGLRSRFNKYIIFDDYSSSEMLEIFESLCTKNKFILSPPAQEAALQYFAIQKEDPTFGNARGVRNYFDRVVMKQASRILSLSNPSEEEFKTILEGDVL